MCVKRTHRQGLRARRGCTRNYRLNVGKQIQPDTDPRKRSEKTLMQWRKLLGGIPSGWWEQRRKHVNHVAMLLQRVAEFFCLFSFSFFFFFFFFFFLAMEGIFGGRAKPAQGTVTWILLQFRDLIFFDSGFFFLEEICLDSPLSDRAIFPFSGVSLKIENLVEISSIRDLTFGTLLKEFRVEIVIRIRSRNLMFRKCNTSFFPSLLKEFLEVE